MSQASTLLAPNQSNQKSGLSGWAIAGITIGIILFLVVVVVILYLLFFRRKKGLQVVKVGPTQTGTLPEAGTLPQ